MSIDLKRKKPQNWIGKPSGINRCLQNLLNICLCRYVHR